MVTVLTGRLRLKPSGTMRSQLSDLERQQHAIPSPGIGVDADELLAVEILDRVGNQAVLAQHDDQSSAPKMKLER